MALELPPQASHYVARVCRAHPGECLVATDGRGGRAEMIVHATGRSVTVEGAAVHREARARHATLACGPPESERGDMDREFAGDEAA